MVGSPIAETFVRIRPNMHGFKQETEAGVRSSFAGIGKIIGVSLGAVEGFRFGKDIIGHAADMQRQVRAVKEEFGAASEVINEFSDNGAVKLGISAHAAEKTAARFGILFAQLGIGKEQAANMTVGLEQLAGSISQIRNIDPAIAMANLPLAVAGNLRSLKQLGIATDQTQIKIAAFKLGITQSITQALTPGQRAIAIYAIATGHLDDFMKQAASNSGDLAVQQRILSAEWDNAKDSLGRGLLPETSKFAQYLAVNLPGAIETTKKDFRTLGHDIDAVTHPLGGLKKTLEIIAGAFLATKVIAAGRGIVAGVQTRGANAVRASNERTAREVAIAQGKIQTRSLSVAESIKVGLGGSLRALGPAAEEGSTQAVAAIETIGGAASTVGGEVKTSLALVSGIGPAITGPVAEATAALEALKVEATTLAVPFGTAAAEVDASLAGMGAGIKVLPAEIQTSVLVAEAELTGFAAFTAGVTATIKALLISTGFGALAVAAGFAVEYIITHWSKVKRWFQTFLGWLKTAFHVAWAFVVTEAKTEAFAMIEPFAFAVEQILGLASHLPGGFGRAARKAKREIEAAMSLIKPDFSSITDALSQAGNEGGKAFVDAYAASVHAEVQTFGGTLPALSALLGHTVNDAVSKAVVANKKTDADIAKQALRDSMKHQVDDLNGTLKDVHVAIKKLGDGGIPQVRSDLATLNEQLAEAVKQEGVDLRNVVESAKQNLGSLAQNISDVIGQVLDKPLQNAQDKINRLGNRQSLENLRQSILLPGGTQLSKNPQQALRELEALRARAGNVNRAAIDAFINQYRAAVLTVQQDNVNVTKDAAQKRISDLTDQFNRGKIGLGEYKKRILAELTRDHISYKRAGELLGTAFANGFKEKLSGLFEQAGLIATGPHVKGTTGQAVNIIRPLDTLHQDQLQIKSIQKDIGSKQIELQKKIATQAEKQAKLMAKAAATLEQIHSVQLGKTGSPNTRTPGHQGRNAKQLTGTGS